jgi:hypothetical protein
MEYQADITLLSRSSTGPLNHDSCLASLSLHVFSLWRLPFALAFDNSGQPPPLGATFFAVFVARDLAFLTMEASTLVGAW